MRIVIKLKKDSNAELVISNLYKTALQTNFGAIALIKQTTQLSLKQYLNFFLNFEKKR